MSREDDIRTEGVVTEVTVNRLLVQLDSGPAVPCYVSGKMLQRRIRCLVGDRVAVSLSVYSPTSLGRVTYRL